MTKGHVRGERERERERERVCVSVCRVWRERVKWRVWVGVCVERKSEMEGVGGCGMGPDQ